MAAQWLFAACLCGAAAASAQDFDRGALLYDSYCVTCHREGLHDRQNSKVATYADLRYEVERWTRQAGRTFSAAEREDLVEFLDAKHYRLERNPRPDKKL
ncbi:MAG TPA: cytochrome c [Burkholderiales bacterium]|nr:cytochrome c [Burkholderiales bacterium]